MARYPGAEGERRFPEATLRDAAAGVFRVCGMVEPDAALLSDSLVQADLRPRFGTQAGRAKRRMSSRTEAA